MLDRMESYMWPGAKIGAGASRVSEGGRYRENLNQQKIVFSNRIFRKCIQEIQLLPPKEAARLLESHIDSTLSAYIDAYQSGADPNIEREEEGGEPVFQGLRYKLFALLLIAGASELTDNHAVVGKVANIALEQKKSVSEKFADAPSLEIRVSAQHVYLVDKSLWNTYILSAGLYGTHPHKDLPEFNDIAQRYVEKSLVDYTARRTEFDDDPFKKVVPDKEYIKVRCVEEATDDDVLLLLGVVPQ